ncbi:MAG: hypothetical protein LRY36_02160 [Alphaproteobacteria bacterium]|nr:hypothetical protein [Alphaproteobacteria bacterium]
MNVIYITAGDTPQANSRIPANNNNAAHFPITLRSGNSIYQDVFGPVSDVDLHGMGIPDMVYLESHLDEEGERAVIAWIMEQYPQAGIVLVCDADDENTPVIN